MPKIIHLSQTQSTNQYLRHYVESTRNAQEGTIIWADFQTAGRGQQGNSWESENNQNLLFTLLLCPTKIPARDQFIISQIVSIGIIDTLNTLKPGFTIKWPNDIYFKDSKVAGILIENDLSGQTLYNSFIGIGLNVNQRIFNSQAPNPISLFHILGEEFEREKLLEIITERILYFYSMACNGDYHTIQDHYFNSLYRKEGFHPYADKEKTFEAKINKVDLTGLITLVDKEGNQKVYDFKEIKFII